VSPERHHGEGAHLNAKDKISLSAEHVEMLSRANPLTVIYWTRLLLGILAALISAVLGGITADFNLLNGISIALLIYIITYYVYKSMFLTRVEKASKLFTTGVGAYFLSWLAMWAFFFTLLQPQP